MMGHLTSYSARAVSEEQPTCHPRQCDAGVDALRSPQILLEVNSIQSRGDQ